MPDPKPISTPAGFAPAFAVGFSDPSGGLAVVEAGKPLPVAIDASEPLVFRAAAVDAPPAIEGSTTADAVVGPFVPVAGRPVVLSLAGDWQGAVRLERSIDNGASRVAVTAGGMPWGAFTGNACEPVWVEAEDGAQLYLAITLTSGTLSYRIAQ